MILLLIFFKIHCKYNTLKENCIREINPEISPFDLFEIKSFNLDVIKERYRELSLSCHPDRIFYIYPNITDSAMEILNNNMILINDRFVALKKIGKHVEEKPKEEKKKRKRYKDFPLKYRFFFKLKRYTYPIITILLIYVFIRRKNFRIWLERSIFACLFVILLYSLGLFNGGILFFIYFILYYCFCRCCCGRKKK